MLNKPNVKVCGITRQQDVQLALTLGIAWLGINVHPKSPRYVPFDKINPLLDCIPRGKRVCVDVMPTLNKLAQCQQAGFDFLKFTPMQIFP